MDLLIAGGTQFVGRHIVETALKRGHKVTLLNRGQSGQGLFPGVERLTADRTVDVSVVKGRKFDSCIDVSGYFHRHVRMLAEAVKATVPHFREHGGGVILNIGSTAGLRPRPGLTWYNGSKGAANLLSKSMAVELAPDRIRVNAIAPVAGETPLLATFMGEDTPEKRKAFTATIPWGRFSTPQDIANAALFLCSDEAEMVTGSVLAVDGGRCV